MIAMGSMSPMIALGPLVVVRCLAVNLKLSINKINAYCMNIDLVIIEVVYMGSFNLQILPQFGREYSIHYDSSLVSRPSHVFIVQR
jgi:hypothetical protein